MQLEATSLQDAANQIVYFRRYKPYQYSGKWFIAKLGDTFFAFRTKLTMNKNAVKLGLTSYEMVILE